MMKPALALDAALPFLWKAGAIASSGAAGAAAVLGDGAATVGLGVLSGVCAVSGAIFWRSQAGESVRADLFISVVMAFLLGFALGPFVGELGAIQSMRIFGLAPAGIERRILGGALVGLAMTPALRWLIGGGWNRLAKAFADRIGGGK